MATVVCFHAHPDDEVIGTGGLIARAAAEGHRVVLVVATDGDHGEVPDDLAAGESLVMRRRAETDAAAAVLGIERVAWLGFADSGMTGWPQNDDPASFWRADVDDAAARLSAILREEAADVLTIYDWHGGYGHPDHIQVHRVGSAAARDNPHVRVLEATMNRDHLAGLMGDDPEFDVNGPADDGNPFGTPEAEITLAVDVAPYLQRKRDAMRCHRSQISDASFFLDMPDEAFAASFGTEWFIEHDRRPPHRTGWIFDDRG
jgi:LmbE family N-acetylglucosaminyl deacetylase